MKQTTDNKTATVRQKAPTVEREPSASREDLIAHIDFLTRKRAQESQRYAKLWEERHDYKAQADKLAEALRDALNDIDILEARQTLADYEAAQ